MDADVRIVQLTRKIIRDQNGAQTTDKIEQRDYFATDYFDVMKVEKKELSAPLTSIMGIWSDGKMDGLDVAVQSYSLYCNKEMLEFEKGKAGCGDPFLSESDNMPFLSMIQVHITPEVIAHALTEDVVVDAYKDLHAAMQEFIEACEGYDLVFRIYKMLSAGDFAIVIRCVRAETSFEISSLLKRRVANTQGETKIVLYKTYTLLTFENNILKQEIDEQSTDSEVVQEKGIREDCFVLRCCYSNLYWSNKEKVDEYLRQENVLSNVRIYGLNGRYDFSVYVTEKQFLELLHDIKEYKETGTWMSGSKNEKYVEENATSEENGIIKYMRYLMENCYLSYINERYLISRERNDNKPSILCGNKASDIIGASSLNNREDFLDCRINRMYEEVSGNYQNVRQKINSIKGYRKNMMHYMGLLDRLIKLCYGINGFSDTRIYAAVLLEQLGIIVESIRLYMEMYNSAGTEEKGEFLSLLEEYIRKSVCTLDGYAQYIRNNNLQSIQTPNYNIESNMGMEKLLVGYGEFLAVFTEFYQRKKLGLSDEQECCQYLPIVVPVLSERDVSVEIIFPKGMMNDWNKEKEIISKLGNNRCCMVISVPTLAELGNVRTMVTSLFHEVAHQFRYESRKDRNDALLKYVIRTTMNDVVKKLSQKLQKEAESLDWNNELGGILESSLVEAYLEANYMDNERQMQYDFQKVPLNNFQLRLINDLRENLTTWDQKSADRPILRAFVKGVLSHCKSWREQCLEAVRIIDELFDEMEQGEQEKHNQENLSDKIVKCAYGIAWECARVNRNIDCMWKNKSLMEWLEDKEEILYEKKWSEAFGATDLDVKTDIGNIWRYFYLFSYWIYNNDGNNENRKFYDGKRKDRILKKAYQKLCEKWNGDEMQKAWKDDVGNVLPFMGRMLGIDCNTEENYKIFEEQISSVIVKNLNNIFEMAEWRIKKYREETADMFMCNAMKLTPFGYMYMLAVSWPSDQELSEGYYSRSQNILLFQWCLDENEKLSYDKFKQVCVELVRTLEKSVGRSSKRLIDMGEQLELPQNTDVELNWDSDDEKQVLNMSDRIEEFVNYCQYVEEKIANRNDHRVKKECEMLRFYAIMAHTLNQLVGSGKEQIDYFSDFKELRDDYIRGIKHLKKLNDDMCNDNNPLVKRLGEFCKGIGRLQNEPYLTIENAEENAQMNAKSIDFLLSMYYENKRRVARQIGGEYGNSNKICRQSGCIHESDC